MAQAGAQPGPGEGYTTQEVRLDFSFTVHEPKAVGRVAYRYALQVSNDWLQLTRATGVRGSVYAATEAACATAVTGLLTGLNLGKPVRDGYVVDREYESGVNVTALVRYDFEAEYQTKLAGDNGVIECSVSESVRYSAVGWIE